MKWELSDNEWRHDELKITLFEGNEFQNTFLSFEIALQLKTWSKSCKIIPEIKFWRMPDTKNVQIDLLYTNKIEG